MNHRFWYELDGSAWCLACHATDDIPSDCPISKERFEEMVTKLKNSVKHLDKPRKDMLE